MPGRIPNPTYIYRITHYQNLPFILRNGLCCPNHRTQDPGYINIGHKRLIDSRGMRQVPVGPLGVLNDYVPFYFAKKSPMLFLISRHNVPDYLGEQSEIIYLVSTAQSVQQAGIPFVFTDRHAKLSFAQFRSDLNDLSIVDWDVIRSDVWYNTPREYDRKEKKQAEFLVHQNLPIELILGIACHNAEILRIIEEVLQRNASTIPVRTKREWYY